MANIALIGPGAIGCALLGALGHNTAHVLVACARTPFRDLIVETPETTLTLSPRVLTSPRNASVVDWVLVTTKAYDVTGAKAWFPNLLGPKTRVAVIQNGVEHIARFTPFIAAERIVPVVIDCPVERLSQGHVRQRGRGSMLVPDSPECRAFAGLFNKDLMAVQTTSDWLTAAWRKLALNAAGAVSALTLIPAGIAHVGPVADVMRGIVREVVATGRLEGARLDDSLVEEIIERCRSAPRDGVNSMHADRINGRRMEHDARNGVIVRLGRKHGIATPYNETMSALLSALDPART